MNQTDGDKILANAKKSHYQTHHMIEPRPSSTGGFQSFLRWFKKTEHRRHKRQTSIKQRQDVAKSRNLSEPLHQQIKYDSNDTLSPPSSPNLSYSDYSSSCDSVFSTATTGFAFIQPKHVTPHNGYSVTGTRGVDKSIAPGPFTDSYRRRLNQIEQARKYDQKYKLTLRKKYNLYDTSTLKSEDFDNNLAISNQPETSRNHKLFEYTDLSLPNPNSKEYDTGIVIAELESEKLRKNRRTVSDSSKDKKAGAYVHVKGKRKAPPPPIQLQKDNDTSIPTSSGYCTGTLSPLSTLGRREKRKAPQPPTSPFSTALSDTISTTSLLEDKEIRAIIEGGQFNRNDSEHFYEMNSNKVVRNHFFATEEQNVAAGLTEAQKQLLIDNVVKSQNSEQSTPTNSTTNVPGLLANDMMRLEKGLLKFTKHDSGRLSVECDNPQNGPNGLIPAPLSPISPRPWYKRPLSSNKESTIPYKRDVILKTMDKRKNKTKKQIKDEARNSLLDGGNSGGSNRFGFFSRLHEKTDDMKKRDRDSEKRRSGIGIPNISELDREAAEIVKKELMSAKTRIQEENNKYFKNPPEQLMLQTQMFSTQNPTENNDDIAEGEIEVGEQSRRKSTKELISKFEATSSNITKITINPSFLGRNDLFCCDSTSGTTSPSKIRKDDEIMTPTSSHLASPPMKLDNIFNFNLPKEKNNYVDDDVVFMACNKLYQPPLKQTVTTSAITTATTTISDKTKTLKENYLENSSFSSNTNNDSHDIGKKPEVINSTKNICNSNGNREEMCDKEDKNKIHGLWTCPYCTLENPNWRIICEVCEKMKPYNMKKYFLGEKGADEEKAIVIPRTIASVAQQKPTSQQSDWEKKTEKVLKYFKPRSNTGNALSKSASETSVNNKHIKQASSTEKHIGSPKIEKRHFQFFRNSPDKSTRRNSPSKTNTIKEEDSTLLDNSVVVTTIATVFEPATIVVNTSLPSAASKLTGTPNLDEIRNVRLARFAGNITKFEEQIEAKETSKSPIMLIKPTNKPTKEKSESPKLTSKQQEKGARKKEGIINKHHALTTLVSKEHEQKAAILSNDPLALEKEKERLREKIRSMNAKALAEKYPVAKQLTIDPIPEKQKDKDDPTKLGAIKKLFTKKPGPFDYSFELHEIPAYAEMDQKNKHKAQKVSTSVQTHGILRKTDYEKLPFQKSNETTPYLPIRLTDLIIKPVEQTNAGSSNEFEPMHSNDFLITKKANENVYANYPFTENNHPDLVQNNHVKFSEKEKAKLVEISEQLQSQKGVDDFKATFKTAQNNTNTLVINKILRNLENAILDGEHEAAAGLAMDLAKMKVSLSVTRQKDRPISMATEVMLENQIIVDMFVEDSKTQKGPLQISVSPLMTVKTLRLKIEKDFQIPCNVQRWILNDQLAADEAKTLLDFGVKESKSVIYLYIVDSAEEKKVALLNNKAEEMNNVKNKPSTSFSHFDARILSISDSDDDGSEQNEKVDCDVKEEVEESGAIALPAPITKIYGTTKADWHCLMCTLLNPPDRQGCSACSQARPASYMVPEELKYSQDDFPEELKRFLEEDNTETAKIKTREPKNDLNKITTNRKSTDIFNIPFTDFTVQPGTSTSTNVTANKTNNLVHAVLKAAEIKKEKSNLAASTTTTLASTSKLPFQIENKIIVATAFTSSPNITKNKYRGVYNFNPTTKTYELPKVVEPQKSPEHAPVIKSAILKTNVNPQLPKVMAQQPKKISVLQTRHRADKRPAPKPPSAAAKTHYLELLDLDHAGAVKNIEPFECPICFMDYDVGQGVILRDCLHTFCQECLANTVQHNEDPVIKCPYMDTEYSCDSVLQEREIKSLVTHEIYEQHLAKSVRQAEHEIQNTFHCKTPNCGSWCIYEDNVNQFKCPVCKIVNCLLCRAVHDGLNCKQYQDRVDNDCDNDADAKRTKEIIQQMVEKGDALTCPTCHVIMMKKWGCDWIKCSMCKTEICWVTRGPRWGPGGKGDTTAGCKCGVNGKKCHPKCNYCH